MDVSLKLQSDKLAWASVFRILGFQPSVSIWKIIGIPKPIADNPDYILRIAQTFFLEDEGVYSGEILVSEEDVSNRVEAQRMIDLAHLYKVFGRIVAHYNEENAIKLYEWGKRSFIHEKSIFWENWYSIFSEILKNQTSLMIFLDKNDSNRVVSIIKDQFKQKTNRKENLDITSVRDKN